MKISLIYAYWPNQPDGVTWCDLPWALRDKGLPKRLDDAGHDVIETMLVAEEAFPEELRAGLGVAAEISKAVTEAVAEDELAVVLAGSCALAALGAVGGLGSDTDIAWFDAHPDLNTPETSVSGIFEGMALAAATGRAWQAMVDRHARIDGPASLANVTLFGARDIDPPEQVLIDGNGIEVTQSPDALAARLSDANRVYAHLDMDVHDAVAARANAPAVPDGPDVETVRAALANIPKLNCLGITGLDPVAPDAARAADIAIDHVLAVAGRSV